MQYYHVNVVEILADNNGHLGAYGKGKSCEQVMAARLSEPTVAQKVFKVKRVKLMK